MFPIAQPLALGLAYCLTAAVATPLGPSMPRCPSLYQIHINSQDTEPGAPVNSAGYCRGSGEYDIAAPLPRQPYVVPRINKVSFVGCVITTESSYTVGVTWTVGVGLGINIGDIISAGVTAEVSNTDETGTAEGSQAPCPDGPWICGLAITPPVQKVKGIKQPVNDFCQKLGAPQPYEVELPLLKDGRITSDGIEACACKDFEHWADPGAPPLCPAPCAH